MSFIGAPAHSRWARACAAAPWATAISQQHSTRKPTDRMTPVKRFRMEVVRVYLNLYTDRCGDNGRLGIRSSRNRYSARSSPSPRSAWAQGPPGRRSQAAACLATRARARLQVRWVGSRELTQDSCDRASTYPLSLPEFTFGGHERPRKNNAQHAHTLELSLA